MAKKIFLSPSNQTRNTYAYGNTTEDVQCGKIAKACEIALKRCGFEVKVEQYDTMQNRVVHSDEWGADLHVPIHTNAFNGKVGGTRILYYQAGTEGHKAAKAVLAALKDLTPGTSDRCNLGSSLYELSTPKATAVYVEAEFHDVKDYAKWIIEHTTEIGEAICKGICDYFGIEYKLEEPDGEYYIQMGSYKKKSDADTMLAKLKEAGFNAFIVTNGGVTPEPVQKEIQVGSIVKLQKGAKTYAGKNLASFVYDRNHEVKEINGDRVVITYTGIVVAAVKKSDLILID